MNNKIILITGAAGILGQRLTKILVQRGYSVVAMVRENTRTDYLESLKVKIVRADLRKKETLYPAFKSVGSVVHLATTMKGPWEEYWESTVNGTKRLLEIAAEKQIEHFIFISSIAVYDAMKAGGTITETSPLCQRDLSNYEKSKIEAEKIVMDFAGRGLPCSIVRSGVIYGPGGVLYPPRLGFSAGNSLLVIGNGENCIPLVYIDNLIEGIIAAIEKQAKGGEIYNFVDDQLISQNAYLQAVKERLKPSLNILHLPYGLMVVFAGIVTALLKILKRPSPLRKSYLYMCSRQINYSNQKAKGQLNWVPPFEPNQTLESTMRYFKDQTCNDRIVDSKTVGKTIILNKVVNIGIIGCGVIAKTHLDILKRIRGVNIVGFCDSYIQSAHDLSKEYGGSAYSNIEDIFKKQKLDVIHVLTPPQGRKEIVETAARNGCHIFLEKPMAFNALEARAIVQEANRHNVKVCVGHNHLFDPPMIEARKFIASGVLGEILYADSWYGFNLGANLTARYMMPGAEKHWSMQLPGKLYQNLISHPLSVLADVLGYPQEVYAVTMAGNIVKSMKNDELKVMMKCNGKVGTLTLSLAVNPRYQFLNVYGTEACLFVDFLNKTLVKHTTPKGIPKPVSRAMMSFAQANILEFSTIRNFFKVATKTFTYFDGTEILVKEFYKRLQTGEPMPVSGEDGLKSMEVMDEIWRQIRL